jgi:hypothetical protein
VVVALLSDPKVEVRHLAAATLSGMIKGMAPPAREALQAQLLGQAAQLFKTGRKRAKQAVGSSAQVSRRTHAASAVQCIECTPQTTLYVCSHLVSLFNTLAEPLPSPSVLLHPTPGPSPAPLYNAIAPPCPPLPPVRRPRPTRYLTPMLNTPPLPPTLQALEPSSSSSAVAKLACVQGLKAFVMSSPYDCPDWMPQVLMALVAAAGDSSAQVSACRGAAQLCCSYDPCCAHALLAPPALTLHMPCWPHLR